VRGPASTLSAAVPDVEGVALMATLASPEFRSPMPCTASRRPAERTEVSWVTPVSIEYQAVMIGAELEESAGWTAAGMARVLTGEQARTIAATGD
jgi:hypothetical protein